MTPWPPPYPRVPHLSERSAATPDDLVLSAAERDELLSGPVLVEEKLDGANVMLWLDARGVPQAATRGGPGAMDRGGQLGPLRAWIGPHGDELRRLLEGGRVLYGEWLWKRHSVRYSRLHDWLVGLDVLERSGEWRDSDDRDRLLADAGLEPPPVIAGPARRDLGALLETARTSALGDDPAEGVVVRRAPGSASAVRLAKLVFPAFRRMTDDEWASARAGNQVER